MVREFLGGKDVFGALPIGYGKSLCYAVLPYAFNHVKGYISEPQSIVLVVSPLTSLMLDQRAKFSPRGLRVEFVRELQSDPQVLQNIQAGKFQLVFVSPESLLTNPIWREMVRSLVYQENLVALVDKAHCVKKEMVCASHR